MKIKSEIEISAKELKTAVQLYLNNKLGTSLIVAVENLKDANGDFTLPITASTTLEQRPTNYMDR